MISVIIPAYNEAGTVGRTVREVECRGMYDNELIVIDGGSTDTTIREARSAGAAVVESPLKGRAAQLNFGAEQATGDILFFLHADTIPPIAFDSTIKKTITDSYSAGCFRLSFDEDHFLLNLYGWFTRFDIDAFRFGDQGLFIRRSLFETIGGYREDHLVMEDNEIVRRIKGNARFQLLPDRVETAARKYRDNGIIRLQAVFFLIYVLYMLGVSQKKLLKVYRKFIH